MGRRLVSKKNIPGSTFIADASGLIPTILTQQELDEREFANINQAMTKYLLGSITEKKAPFTLTWLHQVHEEMYGQVWSWAGAPRQVETNIGVLPIHIQTSLQQLLGNLQFWRDQKTMDPIEMAARLHHGLVQIHPYPNGNGRWARLIANIFLKKMKQTLVFWPEDDVRGETSFRNDYMDSLKRADAGDFSRLIALHRQYQGK